MVLWQLNTVEIQCLNTPNKNMFQLEQENIYMRD